MLNVPQFINDPDKKREGIPADFFLSLAGMVEFVEAIQEFVDQVVWWDERSVGGQESLLIHELYKRSIDYQVY